jgi:hypothetical protein
MRTNSRSALGWLVQAVLVVGAAVIGGVLANPNNIDAWLARAEAQRISPEAVLVAVYAAKAIVLVALAILLGRLIAFCILFALDRRRQRRRAAARKLAKERRQRAFAEVGAREQAAERERLEKVLRSWWLYSPEMRSWLIALNAERPELPDGDELRRLEDQGAIRVLAAREDPRRPFDEVPPRLKICELSDDARQIIRQLQAESPAGQPVSIDVVSLRPSSPGSPETRIESDTGRGAQSEEPVPPEDIPASS